MNGLVGVPENACGGTPPSRDRRVHVAGTVLLGVV